MYTNKKNEERKYRNAYRAFINRQDEKFEDALDHIRFLNKGDGAPWVSDGAWKIINRLAKIKFPSPPYGYMTNTKGTLSYLAARSRWAEWWLRIIMRTMSDAVAKPISRPLPEKDDTHLPMI